ncbi:hypothetical protein ADU20_27285 [Burkholderia pseudomallei]|uniref:hypothetical protein n=1 Tax=Burkholderia pseudomallei TaxID=28450 RepID=UPI000681E66E|nr:hypothetical protein [Burkholderia pseudomallei]KNA31029.1 hypothetical protein ADU20_27285 [Burkholderia pseudomallei]
MKWLIDRTLLLLTALAFVGAFWALSHWLGAENFYSLGTTVTICALWFECARLRKLLRKHGVDLYPKRKTPR